MKFTHVVLFSLAAIAASPVFAQGKGGGGGGNSGGGNGGGNAGGGFGAPGNSGAGQSNGGGFDRPKAKPAAPDSAKGAGKGDSSASSAAHGLATSMHDINKTSFAQRRELHQTLDMSLSSSRDALKKIQMDAKAARIDARADFKSALDVVKKRDAELVVAIKASKKADEAHWNTSRDLLGRAYQNHNDALSVLNKIPRPPTP